LLSLDVFRGLAMAAMVLVENPGLDRKEDIYAPLLHADWHTEPITFKDCILPLFLFCMGISLTLSLARLLRSGASRLKIFRKIVLRSFIILALGLFLHFLYYVFYGVMRIPGVLQRLALVYFICGCLFIITSWRTQLVVLLIILIGYWLLLTLVPVPGIGPANLDPDTNLVAWVDRAVFNGYLHPRFKTSDPQGLLGSLSVVSSCLLGMLTGHWLSRNTRPNKKLLGFFIAAVGLIALGRFWGLVFPISRDLWTGSYALYTTGLAMSAWSLCYWLVEVQNFQKWTKPLAAYGTSCIFVFVASHVFDLLLREIRIPTGGQNSIAVHDLIMNVFFSSWLSYPPNASLLFAFCIVLFWLLPLYFMYQKRIYIKV